MIRSVPFRSLHEGFLKITLTVSGATSTFVRGRAKFDFDGLGGYMGVLPHHPFEIVFKKKTLFSGFEVKKNSILKLLKVWFCAQ